METTYTLNHTTKLFVLDCCTCGVAFGMPDSLDSEFRRNGRYFYCPNGHQQYYSDSEEKRLKRQLEAAEAKATRIQAAKERAEAEARHMAAVAAGHKGAHTKTKRRVAHGVCPCCNRTFANVARHMAGQHPDYIADVAVNIDQPTNPTMEGKTS